MEYCDVSPSVTKWASEEVAIRYYFPGDGRWHSYYPDFILTKIEPDHSHQTYMIEIKPEKQTRPPVRSLKSKTNRKFLRETLEFGRNMAKWTAAEAFCKGKGWKFKVVTERNLYPQLPK